MIEGRQAPLADCISQKEREKSDKYSCSENSTRAIYLSKSKEMRWTNKKKQPVNMVADNKSRQGVEKGPDSVADEAAANLAGHWTWCHPLSSQKIFPRLVAALLASTLRCICGISGCHGDVAENASTWAKMLYKDDHCNGDGEEMETTERRVCSTTTVWANRWD